MSCLDDESFAWEWFRILFHWHERPPVTDMTCILPRLVCISIVTTISANCTHSCQYSLCYRHSRAYHFLSEVPSLKTCNLCSRKPVPVSSGFRTECKATENKLLVVITCFHAESSDSNNDFLADIGTEVKVDISIVFTCKSLLSTDKDSSRICLRKVNHHYSPITRSIF